eukprot:scaffold19434_cov69-Phaeocystis_antarctica.AAC.3
MCVRLRSRLIAADSLLRRIRFCRFASTPSPPSSQPSSPEDPESRGCFFSGLFASTRSTPYAAASAGGVTPARVSGTTLVASHMSNTSRLSMTSVLLIVESVPLIAPSFAVDCVIIMRPASARSHGCGGGGVVRY